MALNAFRWSIIRNLCGIVNISHVGIDFKNGNAWRATKGAEKKFYHKIGQKIYPGKDGSSVYQVTHLRYRSSSNRDLRRLVIFMEDSNSVVGELAIVQYTFDEEPHEIEIRPHGTSKIIHTDKKDCHPANCVVSYQTSVEQTRHA